ncbi:MAG: T9SS type A sorting domain-containing protein, partial [Bacteroidales bacterium]|nr:T9SS type A sorting domain-containing protein [Bacteroidales bacterium]
SSQASFNFSMPAANTTLTANFNTVYTVTYSVIGGNGSLAATVNGTAISSGSSVVAGSDVVFTATPANGYKVKEWKANGTVVSGNTSNNYTVEDIAANTTVNVEFELITYTLTFIVKATDNTLLEGASININSETIVTNASGEATIDLAPGTYDYTVTLQDYLDVTESVTITNANVTENVEMSHVGIVEGDFAQFSVYPNPFSNEITISNPQIVKSVSISAINGQVLSIIETEGKASINTENLPVGMYLITFESHNGERFISKMVKN